MLWPRTSAWRSGKSACRSRRQRRCRRGVRLISGSRVKRSRRMSSTIMATGTSHCGCARRRARRSCTANQSPPTISCRPTWVHAGGLGCISTRGWIGGASPSGSGRRFAEVAPKSVTAELGPTIEIDPPTKTLDPEEFDPFAAPRAQDVLDELRGLCLALPETTEAKQFGRPS